MKGQEVHKLNDEEIGVELKRMRNELYTLRTQAVTEKVEDVSRFRKTRRDIARLLTEQSTRSAKANPDRKAKTRTKVRTKTKTSTRIRATAKA